MRTLIWTTAFVLLAGGALAAPSMDTPLRAPRIEGPALSDTWAPSEGWALEELIQLFGKELADEEIQIAGKDRKKKKDGGRGGARSKNRGGFSKGSERNAGRGGGRSGDRSGDRDGDRDIDEDDLDDAYTSDEEKAGAAIVGGVVGLGVGKRISDSEN